MAQPDHTEAPEWVKQLHSEPDWVKGIGARNTPPPRSSGYDVGRQDQELLTAIRAMPEQVVAALRSAIEAATPQQTPAPQQAPAPQQTEQQTEQSKPTSSPDTPPNHGETFADKWFGNKLFS